MNSIYSNNVNFGAKMNLNGITHNKSRWVKIAKEFEKRTQKYPDIVFEVMEREGGIAIDGTGYGKNFRYGDEMVWAQFFNNSYDKLMELSDNAIVSKIKRMMEIAIKKDEIYKKGEKVITEMRLSPHYSDPLYNKLTDKAKKYVEKAMSKDEFLINNYICI